MGFSPPSPTATVRSMLLGSICVTIAAAALTDKDYHRGPWNFNPRCPAAVKLDPPGVQRDPTSGSEYGELPAPIPTCFVEPCVR